MKPETQEVKCRLDDGFGAAKFGDMLVHSCLLREFAHSNGEQLEQAARHSPWNVVSRQWESLGCDMPPRRAAKLMLPDLCCLCEVRPLSEQSMSSETLPEGHQFSADSPDIDGGRLACAEALANATESHVLDAL